MKPELEKTRAAHRAKRVERRAKRRQAKHITGEPSGSARDRRKLRRAGKERVAVEAACRAGDEL